MWPEWPHPLSLYRCVPRALAGSYWTMPDALNRGRAVCGSSRVASDRESRVSTVVLIALPSDEPPSSDNVVVLLIVIVNP